MSRVLLALVALLALTSLASGASLRAEFDGTVAALNDFASLLEAHAQDQADTDASLAALGASMQDGEDSVDASLLEASAEAEADPTYSLPYPAVGGPALFHPYSSVNPLSVGAVPPVQVMSAAAFAASPLSSYYAAAVNAQAAALGVAPGFYPAAAAAWGGDAAAKGGYNRHGLTSGWVGYHPGLSRDLRMLGGKTQRAAGAAGGKASLMEMGASAETEATSQTEADSQADLLEQEALEAEAALDADIGALMQLGAEVQAEAEAHTEAEADAEAEAEAEAESAAEIDIEFEPQQLLEAGAEQAPAAAAAGANAAAAKPANPTYVLPYPPVLPGHYTPLFNPYTNVNPLSTPFANVAAQPGAHPGVAAAAAAQAASLASVSGHIAGAAGGYPMYPFAAGAVVDTPVGNPVPFSGYAGWIHPQQLNSAPVGDNANAASLGQFIELEMEVDSDDCVGCQFN